MNFRILAVALGLAGVEPLSACAQDKAAAKQRVEENRASAPSTPGLGDFRSSGRHYQFASGIRAVALADGDTGDRALTSVGASPSDLIETRGKYVFFRKQAKGPMAAQRSANGRPTLPVAVNVRTGGLGVVPGTLTARLKPASDGRTIAAERGIELLLETSHLGAAFFRVPVGRDIPAAAAALASDPRVLSAEIDVQEYFAEPQ